jgi:hypothetical protein
VSVLSTVGALPTFFIIGAPKAGTTSLHYYLEQHPQIQMSAIKEPGFLASAGPGRDDRKVHRLDSYKQLFDPAVAVRGEASTNYAEYPLREGVPDRIEQLVPDAKFIYLVRDPVERTVSHYHQMVATTGERRPLREALGDISDPRYPCICASLYALQIELYLRRFPGERLLVIDQADLLTERRATLGRIFAFLEVDRQFESAQFEIEFLKSEGRRTYPRALASFLSMTVRPNTRWMPPRIRRTLRRSFESRFLPPLEAAVLDPDLRARLQDLYAGDVERLRALTGEAFASWSI